MDVATSATDRASADAGTGPTVLADSVWSLSRKADPSNDADPDDMETSRGPYGGLLDGDALKRPPVGETIFLVHFGPDGAMTRVTENRFFLPRYYGEEVTVGGAWQGTTLPAISYRSASYGLSMEERFGVAVTVNVRMGNLFLGRAVLYAWGTVAGDEIDGAFGYLLDFTESLVPQLGTLADQYPVEWQRVAP